MSRQHVQAVIPVVLVSVMLLPLAAFLWADETQEVFPHGKHKKLFPTCGACHQLRDDGSMEYTVSAQDCAACHDGSDLDRVDLALPIPGATNFKFDHKLHVQEESLQCKVCHSTGQARMEVGRFQLQACLDCHEIQNHLAPETPCLDCHFPLAEAPELSAAQISSFPKPESHDDPDFIFLHKHPARENATLCATCHSQNLCRTCHINAEAVPEIAALAMDPRTQVQAAAREGRWPLPKSHKHSDWLLQHGSAMTTDATCANCHGQDSCSQCHGIILPPGAESLPLRTDSLGVSLAGAFPPGHVPGFDLSHGPKAAAGGANCMTCHTEAYCEDCHNAPISPGFHGNHYMQAHAGDAYARTSDCAGCHSQEVFCRSCHIQMGLSPGAARDASYHDASGGYWLLAHAQAARQSIDNCASCHQQNDCLKCHSAVAGWGVNPHGGGFDAERAQDRNPAMCARCHFEVPIK